MTTIRDEIENHLSKIYEALAAIHHMVASDPEAVKAFANLQPTEQEIIIRYPVLSKPIRDLPFSVRLTNLLHYIGVVKLIDLRSIQQHELLRTKNFGKKSFTELQNFLKFHNVLHFFPQFCS